MRFALIGAEAFGGSDAYESDGEWEEKEGAANDGDWSDSEWEDTRFVLADSETLDILRKRILDVGQETARVLTEADLDLEHPLPEAPWFEPGVSWSVRRVALHMIAEIAQHAGHADIIREAIDGQKTMG